MAVHWPTTWMATKGYSSFNMGFDTREAAVEWHQQLTAQVRSAAVRLLTARVQHPSATWLQANQQSSGAKQHPQGSRAVHAHPRNSPVALALARQHTH